MTISLEYICPRVFHRHSRIHGTRIPLNLDHADFNFCSRAIDARARLTTTFILNRKLAETQNDTSLRVPRASVLFRGYKLDSASPGSSNIRQRYSQLPNLYRAVRIKYFLVSPFVLFLTSVPVMRPSYKFSTYPNFRSATASRNIIASL